TGTIPHFIDAYFETMSGFTTTGSSILTNIEAMPPGVLFWRSFTHWLGGMGIVLLFIAILPFLGAGGRHLFKSEVSGVIKESLTPRIKETASMLWKIYLLFTVAETGLLLLAGMNLFDALCHTFGTLATGGFSTKNASIAHFNSLSVEIIIMCFIVLAATNFSLHFQAFNGRYKVYLFDAEFRSYFIIIIGSIIVISLDLWLKNIYATPLVSLRYSAFQVISIMTSTGFVTADFNNWTSGAKTLLIILMFIGGCAGSTSGGIKVIRWVILFKIARSQLERVFSPRSVYQIKIGNTLITESLQLTTMSFFFMYTVIFILGTFIVALFDIDLVTSASAVAATLNTVGPGLEKVGAIGNFSALPYPVKALLSIFMVIGRLELYSILVLLLPRFWRNY
ncbi:MAG: TrkH family potassium uptake protein, partial [Candidatus Sumerlaeia bacterium]|nr:TrkH family potassium uptake protein [Candidatus Sumerlaeia bacterium]